ncbi:hypothetical protein VP01_3350g2 [Puccinia sorghi]|uniref:Uncharacterized protein n=1 Tax=Puccinia sorghi TaxID=27349 RepID=A0A0L6UXW3_9BASI|nr:hypothetical protein VP01_3350g2 [Puccinia sorghi]
MGFGLENHLVQKLTMKWKHNPLLSLLEMNLESVTWKAIMIMYVFPLVIDKQAPKKWADETNKGKGKQEEDQPSGQMNKQGSPEIITTPQASCWMKKRMPASLKSPNSPPQSVHWMNPLKMKFLKSLINHRKKRHLTTHLKENKGHQTIRKSTPRAKPHQRKLQIYSNDTRRMPKRDEGENFDFEIFSSDQSTPEREEKEKDRSFEMAKLEQLESQEHIGKKYHLITQCIVSRKSIEEIELLANLFKYQKRIEIENSNDFFPRLISPANE